MAVAASMRCYGVKPGNPATRMLSPHPHSPVRAAPAPHAALARCFSMKVGILPESILPKMLVDRLVLRGSVLQVGACCAEPRCAALRREASRITRAAPHANGSPPDVVLLGQEPSLQAAARGLLLPATPLAWQRVA